MEFTITFRRIIHNLSKCYAQSEVLAQGMWGNMLSHSVEHNMSPNTTDLDSKTEQLLLSQLVLLG